MHPTIEPKGEVPLSAPGKEGQTFILLRYVLLTAAAYLLLFEGETEDPAISVALIAGALLTNVFLAHLPENLLLRPVTLGFIICSDIIWIALGLWHKGSYGNDIFFLYFFILCLAAIGQNLILIVTASVLLSGVDLVLFVIPAGEGRSIWSSPSLVRVPFMFVAALFYGHLAEKVREAKEIGEKRLHGLREIDLAITSTLELHAVLKGLLEKIDLILPYAGATVRLLNRKTGELEPVACRNLDEEEWKTTTAGGGGLARMISENYAPVIVRNAQTDPRSLASEFLRKHGIVSYLRVPLIARSEALGVLTFFTREEHDFSSEEVKFLTTLAAQAAIAIYNAQVYEEMVKANQVKNEFLSVMSHEFRTPLNVITGYTGMLKDKGLGEINSEQEKALQKTIDRSRELLAMINGILYATSIEAEAVKVETHNVNLTDFLNELESSYDIPLSKEVTLKWDYESNLPVVKTDSEKLRHILENLINNAIKFTERGQVTLSARHFPENKRIEFRVTDTGIGIPKEVLPIIFEKFRQLDSSETRLYGGVGMGLYIVKQFTHMLRGKIEVQSEAGKGSSFSVTLPCES